ncbi:MAG: MFS transporter [Candidatus Aminicenantaceae bacterium]
MKKSNQSLLLISTAVFLGSSTWLSGTAAAPVLKKLWALNEVQSSWLTASVQLGFITGTFLFALLNISDLFNTRKVFFLSALAGAACNAAFAGISQYLDIAVFFRFLTGLTLAGIYPVGMKLIAQWFQSGLGWRLGIMVGALTLGTSSPYLIFSVGGHFNWRLLMYAASILAFLGGLLVLVGISDGPYLNKLARFDLRMAFKIFSSRKFRLQAFGYFGHMWELYAFWSFTGSFLAASSMKHHSTSLASLPFISFSVIGIGTLGCIGGGFLSMKTGEKAIAYISLLVSGSLCLLSVFLFECPFWILIPVFILWGIFVVSDSPQYSALAVKYGPPQYTGTALTIQNGIGFGITVISIQLVAWLAQSIGWKWAFLFLAIGPLAGIWAMSRLKPFSK